MKKHWYYIQITECPVCGFGHTYRERRYGKKPKAIEKRMRFIQGYDHCLERDYGR